MTVSELEFVPKYALAWDVSCDIEFFETLAEAEAATKLGNEGYTIWLLDKRGHFQCVVETTDNSHI